MGTMYFLNFSIFDLAADDPSRLNNYTVLISWLAWLEQKRRRGLFQ
jgi:hypothetical protein